MRRYIDIVENEKLEEINLIGDFDDELNRFRIDNHHADKLERATHIGDIDNIEIYKSAEESDQEYYFLVDAWGKIKGKATIRTMGHDSKRKISRVTHIWFDPSIRGQGYGYKFYVYLLEQGYHLQPDTDQTRFAKGVWTKLARNGYIQTLSGKRILDIENLYNSDKSLKIIATLG